MARNIEQKYKRVRKAITSCAKNKYHELKHMMQRTKHIIRKLDIIEEKRDLNNVELQLRIDLRSHAYNLAHIQETKWKQRSSANWLQKGDQNTKYFHAIASAKRTTNFIPQINPQAITHLGLDTTAPNPQPHHAIPNSSKLHWPHLHLPIHRH
jgi:antirestriction protein ArdC